MANRVVVASPRFLAPHPVVLTIVQELPFFYNGNFAVTDVNGDAMFKVEGELFSLHRRRVLLDAAGNPILSFQKKLLSLLRTWEVFKGDSSDTKDIIFSANKFSLNPFKTSLEVFLGTNGEDVCDFKVKGSWFDVSWTIYARDTTTILAQMDKKFTFRSIVLGQSAYSVSVYPNVDYAFIVALVVILHEIIKEQSDNFDD